ITREDGLLKLSLRDGAGQALYLIRVDPAEVEDAQEAWEKAKGRVRKVLEEFLGSGLASQRLPPLRALGLIS
ncbi:MAG: hypothetical protein RXP86_09040, partial [Acidilobus sp.]